MTEKKQYNNFSQEFIDFCGLNPIKPGKSRTFERLDGVPRNQVVNKTKVGGVFNGAASIYGNYTVYDPFAEQDVEVAFDPIKKKYNGEELETFGRIEFGAQEKEITIGNSNAKSNQKLFALILHPQNVDNPLRSEAAIAKGISIGPVDFGQAFFGEKKENKNVSEANKKFKLISKALSMVEDATESEKRELVKANNKILTIVGYDAPLENIDAVLSMFASNEPEWMCALWGKDNLELKSQIRDFIDAELIRNDGDKWVNYDGSILCVVGVGKNADEELLKFFETSHDSGRIKNRLVVKLDDKNAIQEEAEDDEEESDAVVVSKATATATKAPVSKPKSIPKKRTRRKLNTA